MSAAKAIQFINIVKRDGRKESLNIDKIHKVVSKAVEGLSGVSASEVELKSQLQFFDGMKTTDIQETLIKAAADLISEETPNYQYVAGRLISYTLRKEVYGTYQPVDLYTHVCNIVKEGFYTKELLKWYTKEEFDSLNEEIDH